MLTQMVKYLDTVYVSGWQSSSTASSTDEPSPDLADYPMVSTISNTNAQGPRLIHYYLKTEYCAEQGQPAFPSSTVP